MVQSEPGNRTALSHHERDRVWWELERATVLQRPQQAGTAWLSEVAQRLARGSTGSAGRVQAVPPTTEFPGTGIGPIAAPSVIEACSGVPLASVSSPKTPPAPAVSVHVVKFSAAFTSVGPTVACDKEEGRWRFHSWLLPFHGSADPAGFHKVLVAHLLRGSADVDQH